jgi:hypothetical protein
MCTYCCNSRQHRRTPAQRIAHKALIRFNQNENKIKIVQKQKQRYKVNSRCKNNLSYLLNAYKCFAAVANKTQKTVVMSVNFINLKI